MTAFRPVSPDGLVRLLVSRIDACAGVVRLAIDGVPWAGGDDLAAALVEPLRELGRPAHVVAAGTFWHDASVRLEYGREDADAYLGWLDAGALRREVLDAATERGTYLPSLRDPATNRVTRTPPEAVGEAGVVIVSGALLLGLGLPFDLTVHLALSADARLRRVPDASAWTLPAFERYDVEVAPESLADVVVRLNDPRHPAVRER